MLRLREAECLARNREALDDLLGEFDMIRVTCDDVTYVITELKDDPDDDIIIYEESAQ